MSTSPRPLALAALSLALTVLPASAARAAHQEFGPPAPIDSAPVLTPAVSDLARTLRKSRAQPDVPAQTWASELDALDGGATPAFLELLERERVPVLEPAQTEQMLSEPQREILLVALARREAHVVLSTLDRRLELANDLAGRLLALRVLGAVGDWRSIERLVGLALERGEEEPPDGFSEALREALARILARDTRGFGEIERLLQRSPAALRPALVQAAGDTKQARALGVLSKALTVHADLAPVVASQVTRVGRSLDSTANAEVVDRLRSLLQSGDPNVQRSVALALGELRDDRSIPALIELLDGSDAGLAKNACWALQHATGLEFPASGERWRQWYAQERSWFAHEERATMRDLTSRDPAKVSTALREIGRRRTERDALAAEVVEILQRAEPSLRAQACETLAVLGSAVALPALLERLENDIPFCSQSAWRAMGAITGLDLPADAAAWRTALEPAS